MTIELRPVSHEDVGLLYDWFLAPDVAPTWRYRGTTPPPEVFRSQLWNGVLAHFLCFRHGVDVPVAYVSLYDANLSAQHAKVACLVAPELRSGVTAVDCTLAILAYGFRVWPLQKVYYECNSISLRQFASTVERGLMAEEARLVGYELFGDGEWSDLVWLSTSRATFERYSASVSSHRSRLTAPL